MADSGPQNEPHWNPDFVVDFPMFVPTLLLLLDRGWFVSLLLLLLWIEQCHRHCGTVML